MASSSPTLQLAPSIRAALGALRWRLRAYIWLEALALAIIWLGVTFWVALFLDYFPVLVWANEMPWMARAFILVVVAGVLGWILFRYLLSRAFVHISDRSLAVLLERRFDVFHDSLVTSVELAQGPTADNPFQQAMLVHTHDDATGQVQALPLASVFNYRPLYRKLLLAVALVASIVAFSIGNPSAFALAGERLYMLHDVPWPRASAIEVVGLEIQHASISAETAATSQTIDFHDRQAKVAKGASAVLRVRAAADKRIPESCSIVYRTADGDRGVANMKKIGRVKDGYQQYVFDGKPFKGILADLQFDVLGYDHRVRDYHVEVVDSPTLIDTTLACEFPPYMVDEASAQWLPRTEPLTPATQLPIGTRLDIRCQANKPLQTVQVYNVDTRETQHLTPTSDADRFTIPIAGLTGNLTLEITLLDTDGVQSDRPERLFVAATKDEAPKVNVRLAGISSLVTPDVAIPINGTIEDDYAVAKTWFDVMIDDHPVQSRPFALGAGGKVEQSLDFRDLRNNDSSFGLRPQGKLTLGVIGQDKHNLDGGPQSGFGDRWELTVVTADELLSSLEARELGLRRRFEQIITELTETRDELLRAAAESKAGSSERKSDETTISDDDGASVSLRTLIAQRALLQSQKSAQEISGVAAAFADIRAELINNRVDTEERKVRLKEQIADPLHNVAQTQFPELDKRLEKMQATLADAATTTTDTQAAIEQANTILLELDAVLQRMLDLETYNELVELVRSLIDEQEKLMSETKKQQAADLLK